MQHFAYLNNEVILTAANKQDLINQVANSKYSISELEFLYICDASNADLYIGIVDGLIAVGVDEVDLKQGLEELDYDYSDSQLMCYHAKELVPILRWELEECS